MPYVVTFRAYTPPARDDEPWTDVRVEEAAAKDGPWAVLETQPLSPVDTDPAAPDTRTVTTQLATLAAGWYRLTWLDADGDQALTSPLYSGANIAPPLREVADLMLSRLRDDVGTVDTFSAATTPTADQADRFINYGLRRVRGKAGAIPESLADDARHVVALYAAMLAESSLQSEQADDNSGHYERLKELYDAALADLIEEVKDVADGGEPGAADDSVSPLGSFPDPAVRWDCEVF